MVTTTFVRFTLRVLLTTYLNCAEVPTKTLGPVASLASAQVVPPSTLTYNFTTIPERSRPLSTQVGCPSAAPEKMGERPPKSDSQSIVKFGPPWASLVGFEPRPPN